MAQHLSLIAKLMNEQSDEPLLDPDSAVSKIRRLLLHGKPAYQSTSGLSQTHWYQLASVLRRFGYLVEVVDDEEHGRGYRLTNPNFLPVTRPATQPTPRTSQTKSTPLRKALLRGEEWSGPAAADHFKVHTATLAKVIDRLREDGHTISTRYEGAVKYYRVSTDGPTTMDVAPAPDPTPPRPSQSPPLSLSPAPALGQAMQVQMLALTKDGNMQVAIQGEDGATWLCHVDGYLAPT